MYRRGVNNLEIRFMVADFNERHSRSHSGVFFGRLHGLCCLHGVDKNYVLVCIKCLTDRASSTLGGEFDARLAWRLQTCASGPLGSPFSSCAERPICRLLSTVGCKAALVLPCVTP